MGIGWKLAITRVPTGQARGRSIAIEPSGVSSMGCPLGVSARTVATNAGAGGSAGSGASGETTVTTVRASRWPEGNGWVKGWVVVAAAAFRFAAVGGLGGTPAACGMIALCKGPAGAGDDDDDTVVGAGTAVAAGRSRVAKSSPPLGRASSSVCGGVGCVVGAAFRCGCTGVGAAPDLLSST